MNRREYDTDRIVFWQPNNRGSFVEQKGERHPFKGETNEEHISNRVHGKKKGTKYAIMQPSSLGTSTKEFIIYEIQETTEEVERTVVETVKTIKPVKIYG